MNEENNRKTKLLEDLDEVRNRITELEESEQKHSQAENELRRDLEQYRHSVDDAPIGVYILDVQGRIKYMNSFLLKKFNVPSIEEVLETEGMSLPPLADTEVSEQIRKCLEELKQTVCEHTFHDNSGKEACLRQYINPIFNKDGSINGVFGIVEDISDNKNQENDLSRKLVLEKSMRKVLSEIVGVFDIDEAINNALAQLGEISGVDRTYLYLLYENDSKVDNSHEWCAKNILPQIETLQNISVNDFSWWKEKLFNNELVCITDLEEMPEEAEAEKDFIGKQGARSYLLAPVWIKDKLAGFMGYSVISEIKEWKENDILLLQTISDIIGGFLERKRLDAVNRQREERYTRLAQASFEGIFLIDKGEIVDTNHMATMILGYKPSEFLKKEITDFIDEKDKDLVREELAKGSSQPFNSAAKMKNGALIPVEIQAKSIPFKELPLLIVSVRNISGQQDSKKEKWNNLVDLRNSYEGIIQALASAVALRDPFAAGHEKGVAKIACAIAKKMGLADYRIEGIRIAALVHDVGKIGIPLEILSKPGKLTEAELMIIKDHPENGYEMLKDIDFPWPVAKTVMQHHERLDGSGYPEGSAGGEIILEARILGVADTIEAFLVKRSYRSEKGLESVIEEISKNKGKLYDTQVVTAALSVITAEGFSLN